MHEYLILIHDWSHLGIVAALVLAAYVMCSTTCMIRCFVMCHVTTLENT